MNTEKEKAAISRLKAFAPEAHPYWLCYSGGKDSDAVRILAELAGVRYDLEHDLTTVDAPETVRYVREMGAHINIPKLSMRQLIIRECYPPTRIARYCCRALKESNGKGRLKVTGVRTAESVMRSKKSGLIKILGKPKTVLNKADELGAEYDKPNDNSLIMNMDNAPSRRLVEFCYRTTNTILNPIIDWTDADVWEFLHAHGCKSNPLYECGVKRIGCIGCPMGSKSQKEDQFRHYPHLYKMYLNAFSAMLANRKKQGKNIEMWENAQDVMDWWIEKS